MDYVYYIVRKQDMAILDYRNDFVAAVNTASEVDFPCIIFQGCFLTETIGKQSTNVDKPQMEVTEAAQAAENETE